MYLSKDADSVPTFEFPGSDGAGPRQEAACGGVSGARAGGAAWVWGGRGNVCGVCIGST